MFRSCRPRQLRKDFLKDLITISVSIILTYLCRVYFFVPEPDIAIPTATDFAFYANGTDFKGVLINTDPSTIGIYLNYFDQYPCPYYSDRADLIGPEINRMAQLMRSFGSKIIFHTWTVPATRTFTTRAIPNATDNHINETSPLLVDKCLFDDFNEHPAPSNGSIHHAILY
jgi:hypothetical protein